MILKYDSKLDENTDLLNQAKYYDEVEINEPFDLSKATKTCHSYWFTKLKRKHTA